MSKEDTKLEALLSRLIYFNNSRNVNLVPTSDSVVWSKSTTIPFLLDFKDVTSNPLKLLENILEASGIKSARFIAMDKATFQEFSEHPYVADQRSYFGISLPEYMRQLSGMWALAGRWFECEGKFYFENDCKGARVMYCTDYTVSHIGTIVEKLEQQIESLLLSLGVQL